MPQSFLDLSKPNEAHADERLRKDIIIWLTTVRPDNRPHIVPVWFLWDGETILIFSKPDQKIRNLKQNLNVMLALDDTEGGDDVVLIEGEATLLDRSEISTAYAAYAEKYAAKLAAYNWTGESMSREYSEPIRIKPTRVLAW